MEKDINYLEDIKNAAIKKNEEREKKDKQKKQFGGEILNAIRNIKK
jgi:hypothetical protein